MVGALGYRLIDSLIAEPVRQVGASPTIAPSPSENVPSESVAATAKNDVTDSRREASRERAAGNYVLDSHIPWVRERLSERDRKVIDAIMAERGPVYEKMFSEYGMTSQQVSQALHHIALIYQSKLDVRKAMTAQMNAQMDFEMRMQQILGDRHKEYVAFELLSRAREESDFIRQFAQSSELSPISSERTAALHALIQRTGAYSQRTLGSLSGPSDELARPRYGEAAVTWLEESQAILSLSSASVIEAARQQGFTAKEISTLESYFAKEIAAYDRQITQASGSVEGQIAVLERQLAKLKERNANAWATAPYEEALTGLRAKQAGTR